MFRWTRMTGSYSLNRILCTNKIHFSFYNFDQPTTLQMASRRFRCSRTIDNHYHFTVNDHSAIHKYFETRYPEDQAVQQELFYQRSNNIRDQLYHHYIKIGLKLPNWMP